MPDDVTPFRCRPDAHDSKLVLSFRPREEGAQRGLVLYYVDIRD